MEAVKAEPNITPRSLSKQARRKQLIEATIKCIADKGLSGTTMADVTQQAGLSLGIVNLHFQTKEKLLIETLSYISNEYTTGLNEIFNDEKLTTEQMESEMGSPASVSAAPKASSKARVPPADAPTTAIRDGSKPNFCPF